MNIKHHRGTDHYYVAEFNAWGNAVRNNQSKEIRNWCKQTFGMVAPSESHPRWIDEIIWGKVKFRNEVDLMIFLLRWT